jgi:hypothetical protein
MILIAATTKGLPLIQMDMAKMLTTFDLDRNNMAMYCFIDVAMGIQSNMDLEMDSDGNTWDQLSHSYDTWKQTVAPGMPIGWLYGLMRDITELLGTQLIGQDVAVMSYGTNMISQMEAIKFSEGGAVTGTNQPPRPFYGLTFVAIAKCDASFDYQFANAF